MTKRIRDFEDKNKLLFDLLFRHQIYILGVSAGLSSEYGQTLTKLFASFALFFARARYSTLDQLNKAQLNEFLRQFQKEQTHYYNIYVNALVASLRDFLAADVDVSHAIFGHATGLPGAILHEPIYGSAAITATPDGNALLWDKITAEPMPANGHYVEDSIKAFATGAMNNTLAIIRQGYANGWTPQQTFQVICGNNDSNFKDGAFSRYNRQNAALLATVIQHLTANAQAAIASAYYEEYQWISVMDSHTTDVCIARNGVVYVYGKGPLPPAWYHCRSHVAPFAGEKHDIPKNYYEWLVEQPIAFQDDVLGSKLAELLRTGKLNATILSTGTSKPITIEQFLNKIKFILGEKTK